MSETTATHEWISVKDDLPEEGEQVWCYDEEEEVIIGSYWNGRWSHVYGDGDGLGDDTLYYVTHWQPLDYPLPPGEERKANEHDSDA